MIQKKLAFAFIMFLTFMLGALSGVAANASNLIDIAAQINKGIQIIYEGRMQIFRSSTGEELYPITYDNTIYVPLRSVATMLGQTVQWDADETTIYLGRSECDPISYVSRGFNGNKYTWEIKEESELMDFSNGIVYNVWNGSMSSGDYTQTGVSIPEECSVLTFTAWAPQDAVVKLYARDHSVIYSFELQADTLTTKEIYVLGNDYLSIGADAPLAGASPFYLKVFEPQFE